MATADPHRDYLAAEVHTPGIASLLAMVGEAGLTNVRVAHGDAMELVRRLGWMAVPILLLVTHAPQDAMSKRICYQTPAAESFPHHKTEEYGGYQGCIDRAQQKENTIAPPVVAVWILLP